MSSFLMPTYQPAPVAFTHGEGVWLWDTDKKRYLDAISGISVTNLGHAHPAVTEAIQTQAAKLLHTSNLFTITAQEALAKRLVTLTGMSKVFFGNSGAEANEAAIKLARLYGHQQGKTNPTIIVMEKSFHGRTLATLSASGSRKVQAGFEPLLKGFLRAPYNDIAALQHIAASSNEVVAVFVEPIQGESGIIMPDDNYLAQLRALCDEHNWLLMLDEVQTGMGRTGELFAYQHTEITPDVVTSAKALANGVPIGACLARAPFGDIFQPGNHGSTFGGNPLACHTALAVLDAMTKNPIFKNTVARGEQLQQGLRAAFEGTPAVVDVRGKGLMIAIELDRPASELRQKGLDQGLLFNITGDNQQILRLLPPLIITEAETDHLLQGLLQLITDFVSETASA